MCVFVAPQMTDVHHMWVICGHDVCVCVGVFDMQPTVVMYGGWCWSMHYFTVEPTNVETNRLWGLF